MNYTIAEWFSLFMACMFQKPALNIVSWFNKTWVFRWLVGWSL